MENDAAAIEVRDLRKSFQNQRVLDGISLTVAKGSAVAVVGQSGTGKSVLLKLIIGLLAPDSGSIRVQEQEITKLDVDRLNDVRKGMGFLFQSAALYDSLTVEENVAFPLRRHKTIGAKDGKERVRNLLTRVGMESASNKMPAEISGGMKKRVGLARALVLDPSVLLLDEPTSGLDPITASEVNELIQDLREERGVSAIVVTHDMRTVQRVSDEVAMLHNGKIVMEGTFEELQESDHPIVAEFIKQSL